METMILQIAGVILGLLYIWLEYKVNVWMWIVGILMPIVQGTLYYDKGLYADAAINVYYIFAGIYGLICWLYHAPSKSKTKGTAHPHSIMKNDKKLIPCIIASYAAIHLAIYLLLVNFTNSTVPICDSFTTALSIVALWMLSRKYTEQWLVWLVVDLVTVGLYIYKDIPVTASLYMLYSVLAIAGYREWCRMAKEPKS
ncbi:MAG: nicotinamide riboside transporter PnuC [Paludibacteraceae bacterium]|nr:nicotinamide riboside transporter PnuC [Paludibacteraceae bacterium]